MREGMYARALSAPPCDTPTNWTTIATGAWPGTHGIVSFNVHLPGEPLDVTHPTTTSKMRQAESLWEAADRRGHRSAIVNFPVSWPSRLRRGFMVDGTGPGHAQWRVSYANVYALQPRRPRGELETYDVPEGQLVIRPAQGWASLPRSLAAPLEIEIPLTTEGALTWSEIGWQPRANSKRRPGPVWWGLVVGSRPNRYDRIQIYASKTDPRPMTELRAGGWSPWLEGQFEPEARAMEPQVGGSPRSVRGVFKLKLLELSTDATQLSIYRTDVWLADGWASPRALADELRRYAGPFAEGLELPSMAARYRDDWDTYFEQLEQQCDWYTRAAEFLQRSGPWDIMAFQIHVQDGINHALAREVFEGSPDYDPRQSRKYWKVFEQSYVSVDRLVARLSEVCRDGNTVIGIVSDHGGIPTVKHTYVNRALMKAGLLAYREDPSTGKYAIDWARTRAFPRRTHIWINTQGRDPQGIVPPQETGRVADAIMAALYGSHDGETGDCPVELVVRKENARAFGQWGDRVGDLMYFLKPGYTDAGLNYGSLDESPSVEPVVVPTNRVGCAHHQYLPDATLGGFSNSGIFFVAGPGVRKGLRRARPVGLVDVAPTLAHLTDLPPAKQMEGSVIWDGLT
jgi:predicted AlkP superfamily phosphohydrolase/phosphomutase